MDGNRIGIDINGECVVLEDDRAKKIVLGDCGKWTNPLERDDAKRVGKGAPGWPEKVGIDRLVIAVIVRRESRGDIIHRITRAIRLAVRARRRALGFAALGFRAHCVDAKREQRGCRYSK